MWRHSERMDRENKFVGSILATIANSTRSGHIFEKNPKAYSLEDFVGKEKPKSWEDILRKVEHLNKQLGGVDLRNKKQDQWQKDKHG